MHKYVKVWLAMLAILFVTWYGACYGWKAINDPITTRTSWNATLVSAYEYGDRCGTKGRDLCTAWKGRFKEQITGLHFDKEISGFLYHSYIDGGSKPIATSIVLSKTDFGFKTPWYGDALGLLTFAAFVLGFVVFFMGLCIPGLIKEDNLIAARKEYKEAQKSGNWKRRQELEEQYDWYDLQRRS